MKKIVVVLLAVVFLAGVSFADDTIAKTVYSYGVKNTSGVALTTIIPITSIRPSVDKIIGYSIQPINGLAAESYIGLFDGTDVYLTGEVFAESEAAQAYGKSELWAYGKNVSSGVVLRQGASTQAQIYFIRK